MTMMGRIRPRSGAIAAVAAAALFGVSACGGGSAEDSGDKVSATVPDNAFRAKADIAGATSMSVDARFKKVDNAADAQLLAPGVDLHITGVAQLDTLTAEVYADLAGTSPGVDREGKPVKEVYPAKNQAFYAVEYSSDDPQWEPRGEIPDSVASVVVNGNDVAEVLRTDEGTMHRGTIVASLPADSAPDSAVLEVETDGKFQSLSLLDGHRVSSDVEQVYEVADRDVKVSSVDEFEKNFTGWTGDKQRIAGSVADAFVVPWLHRRDGGDGWAGSGKTYLSVEMEWAEFSATSFDETTMHLELDNGKTVQPGNDPSGLKSAFKDRAVFQIPADTKSVTVVVEPQVTVGAGSSAKKHTWDPFGAKIAISGGKG
ncbi:hypothetical protein [Streptomyces sp. TP-A0874]|uniref:hypothetical protein n=1 Tax=Streptomyces sp. TP-A0874 TaxID=549819 RepID=UPI000A649B64|nr:hypothetical protein [Streptomyces sp. TP-A0874]